MPKTKDDGLSVGEISLIGGTMKTFVVTFCPPYGQSGVLTFTVQAEGPAEAQRQVQSRIQSMASRAGQYTVYEVVES